MKIPSKADQIARLKSALEIAKAQGKAKLVITIREMLRNETAKRRSHSVTCEGRIDLNDDSNFIKVKKVCRELSKMPIKLKREKYDESIVVPSTERLMEIFNSRRLVARSFTLKPFTNRFGITVC